MIFLEKQILLFKEANEYSLQFHNPLSYKKICYPKKKVNLSHVFSVIIWEEKKNITKGMHDFYSQAILLNKEG